MAVYDPEKEKTTNPSRDGSHDDLGVHPEHREAEVDDLEKQFAAPSAEASDDFGKEESSELDDGGWNTDVDGESTTDPKKKRRVVIRNVAVGGGLTGLLIGAVVGFLGLSSGPLQFIHISQMLQNFHFGNNESFMESRNRNIYAYLKNSSNGEGYKNNLGRTANKLADHYETRLRNVGIEINYQNRLNGTGRIQSFTIDPDSPQGKKFLDSVQASNIDIPNATEIEGGGRRVEIALSSGSGSTRENRALIKAANNAFEDMGKVSSAISNRLLIKRAGVNYHPITNTAREKGQDLLEYYKGRREARAQRNSEGASSGELKVPGADEADDAATAAEKQEVRDITEQTVKEIEDASGVEAPGKLAQLKTGILSNPAVKAAGVGATVVGLMCTAQSLGNSAEEVQYAKVILPMIRTGVQYVSTGSQVAAAIASKDTRKLADVNWEELGSMSADLYDNTASPNARSFFSAQSIQAEQGKAQTGPDLPEALKPGNIEGKPVWLATLDSVPGLTQACGIQNWASNLPVVKEFGDLTANLTNAAVSVTGKTADEWVGLLVDVIAGVDDLTFATGAKLGNIANYGSLMSANDNAISMGGSALSIAEVFSRDNNTREERLAETKTKSFYQRYFDLYEPDSLAAKTILENPNANSPGATIASFVRSPITMLKQTGTSVTSAFTPSARAQNAIYSYGIPEYGFSQSDIDNPTYEDPFANADIVEPQLASLNEKYGNCFGTTISTSGKIETKETVKYSQTTECNNNPDPMLTRYRFYIADTIAMAVQNCYNLNLSCDELGMGGAQDTSGSTAGATIEGNVFESSENIACAPGTNDLGIHDGYNDGQVVRVRLCAIPNLPAQGRESTPGDPYYIQGAEGNAIVNSRVSGAVLAMVDAAKADGVTLTASSAFRSMPNQQGLFAANPNPNLVARPGYSNHQMGIAIDFAGTSVKNSSATTCASRQTDPGSPVWNWLSNNAIRFGFRQYSAESWHWDASTGASRCE